MSVRKHKLSRSARKARGATVIEVSLENQDFLKRVEDLLEQSRRGDRGVIKKDLICWTCTARDIWKVTFSRIRENDCSKEKLSMLDLRSQGT
ncbi:hypothetical protein TNCT_552611 [Trichonephila clavata]|uniref:Uncharacterized protein n=1 Tax=Trichonephila clavata TaxID=2740835 RepID=A0A8X6GTK0_TRICU|nr:hypothetical protein TNCT_552611 [Trichonephila clavata]